MCFVEILKYQITILSSGLALTATENATFVVILVYVSCSSLPNFTCSKLKAKGKSISKNNRYLEGVK